MLVGVRTEVSLWGVGEAASRGEGGQCLRGRVCVTGNGGLGRRLCWRRGVDIFLI